MPRSPGVLLVLLPLLLAFRCSPGRADTNMLPNSSFEFGYGSVPQDWSGFGFAERALAGNGHSGERCATLKGTGAETSWWYPSRWKLVEYNQLYEVSYWSRADLTQPGGILFAGLSLAARKATPTDTWQQTRFYLRSPDYLPQRQFRLGECYVNGTVYFDDVSLRPVIAAHRSNGLGRYILGSGESLAEGRYLANHEFSGVGSSDARFLSRYTATFDQDRWVLDGIDEVVYHHEVSYFGVEDVTPNVRFSGEAMQNLGVRLEDPRLLRCLLQDAVAVEITVPRCEGTLSIQFATDVRGYRWKEAATIRRPTTIRIEAPGQLLPTRGLWVRLKSDRASRIEVTGYRYTAVVGKPPTQTDTWKTVVGATRYVTILDQNRDIMVQLMDVGELTPNGRSEVRAVIGNKGNRRKLRAAVLVRAGSELISRSEEEFPLARGSRKQVCLGYQVAAAAEQTLRITVTDATTDELLAALETSFAPASPGQTGGGETLVSDPSLSIWWCRPEQKVGRERPAPSEQGSALRISAAANEWEAAQLVLRPSDRLKGCALTISDLVSASGSRIPAAEVRTNAVGYVTVTLASDEAGGIGDWPDPLLPITSPIDVPPRSNQPFWISVHVPAGTPAGDYRGEITVTAEGVNLAAAIEVHVWGFGLPKETYLHVACGLSSGLIRLYHNLTAPGRAGKEELDRALQGYFSDFAAHRVSPAGLGRDIWVDWRRLPTGEVEPTIDFSEFDKDAQRIVDELGCNTVIVKLPGLGGRVSGGWQQSAIGGYRPGTPQYEAAFTKAALAIQDHLSARGWLDETYVIWFDEMGRGDAAFVRDGMNLIKRAAPLLKRMVHGVPDRDLAGAVEVWCVPLHKLDPEQASERKASGEAIWWYPDKRPSAPALFGAIDHCGTEMRLLPWAAWKYGLDGIWLPQANYWHSSAAYPGEWPQNPWTDPMSWVSGIEVKTGEKQVWGNGYGRFLYPPNQRVGAGAAKSLEGPVHSLRWELLRDGIEDYEYLRLLRSEIERLKQSLGGQAGAEPAAYQEAEKLLEVPAEVWTDASHFARTPEPIQAHRAKVAEAIEALRHL